MTNIVVLIKQVPDTWSERKLTEGDYTLDRGAADAVQREIAFSQDRKSTRLNSSHTEIYTLSLPDALPIFKQVPDTWSERKLTEGDYTLDREAADAVQREIAFS